MGAQSRSASSSFRASVQRILDNLIALSGHRGAQDVADVVRHDQQMSLPQHEVGRGLRKEGPPFCDAWETFKPDPAWPIPVDRSR
jgi:hypothetical protein